MGFLPGKKEKLKMKLGTFRPLMQWMKVRIIGLVKKQTNYDFPPQTKRYFGKDFQDLSFRGLNGFVVKPVGMQAIEEMQGGIGLRQETGDLTWSASFTAMEMGEKPPLCRK